MTEFSSLIPGLLGQQGGGGNVLVQFMPIILIFVIMYVLMIRPQTKRQKELRQQLEQMKVGDQIVTSGGIHGIVANKSDRLVTVKVADNVKIKVDLNSIAQVHSKAKAGEADTDSKDS